ncbi:MAG: hypothetical protein ACTSUU_06865 [Candidatus Thorarchaeota archaeon]
MARRRSKTGMKKPRKIGTEELKRTKYSSMANSGHIDDPRWGFSSRKNGKCDVCVFYARFAAKKLLDLLIGEDEVEWLDDNTLRTSGDVTIVSRQLSEIFNHKITYNEDRYHTLGEDHERRAAIIRSDDHAKPFVAGESSTTRKRNSRKGMILIGTIAKELGMTPREARGILRGEMKKPEQGWAWRTTEEVAKIKSLILGQVRTISVDFTGVEAP